MGRTIYLLSSGSLGRKDNTIVIENDGGRRFVPVETTNEILVFGEVDLNKRFLEFAAQSEIILHFFNRYGYYVGTYYPREHLNSGAVIIAQARHYIEPDKRLALAKRFVHGAISNMEKVISYYTRRGKNELEGVNEKLVEFKDSLERCRDISELMGLEGNGRDTYYSAFDEIIEDKDFVFEKRTRRPPGNRLNALISFLNSLCYVLALSQIYRTHMDPRIGFLHETNFRRFSLNLDIAEIFKPILVDRLIFALINKKMIQKKSFSEKGGGLYLTDKAREVVLKAWEDKLQSTIEHPGLRRKVSYQNLVRMEIYKVEKHVLGDKTYEPFVARW